MEPLQLIREAQMASRKIVSESGYYVFGDKRFEQTTKTAFKRTHIKGGYYSMCDIVFFLEHLDIPASEYRKKAFAASLTAIVHNDVKDLKDYLTGVIDTCNQIDRNFAARAAAPAAQSVEIDLTSEKIQALVDFRRKRKRESSELDTASLDQDFIKLDKVQLAKLRSDEYPANTRASRLQGSSSVNFGFVLHLFGENVLLPEKSGQLAQQQQQILEKPPGEAVPAKSSIIIVPNSSISCLSLLNAVDFLCHGKFVSSEEKKNLGAIREAIVTFKRRDEATGEKKYFKIVDNPALIAPEDWDRVVAVFVSGQAWQFKGWKWSNPVDLFRNVLGIYLTFDERPIDPNVMTWNCKILKIKQFERHLDSSASLSFWTMLDNYMKVRKAAGQK